MTRTLTLCLSWIFTGHPIESRRPARLLLLAFAILVLLALLLGGYRELWRSAPVGATRVPGVPSTVSPALREPSKGNEPFPVETHSAASVVSVARPISKRSPPPGNRAMPRQVMPTTASSSTSPAAAATAPQPSVDPYLHRK